MCEEVACCAVRYVCVNADSMTLVEIVYTRLSTEACQNGMAAYYEIPCFMLHFRPLHYGPPVNCQTFSHAYTLQENLQHVDIKYVLYDYYGKFIYCSILDMLIEGHMQWFVFPTSKISCVLSSAKLNSSVYNFSCLFVCLSAVAKSA